ncbi:MAG: nuclear transport factor 2 family protein [Gemmatimonadota bacterium]|nr:nuclear transport factor 2 family protein [Gemmatimonadota bacterium]
MTILDTARRYLDAWNAHDADAIVGTFAAGGTYRDPTTAALSGHAIGANAKGLWSAFPDLAFEIASIAEAGPGRVVAEWVMTGTNTVAFQGLPATGRPISLPGVDVMEIGPDGITSVTGYFDSGAIPVQLGLQVLVQPVTAGPFAFGASSAVQSGRKTAPGAFAITTIWNSDAQAEQIRELTRATAVDMLHMEGFIGVSFIRIGGRGVTISAWEKPEQIGQMKKGGAHGEAMRRFWTEVGDAAYTSVWIPDHINPLWVRCGACGKMSDHEKRSGVCSCGQPLPERPAYF